jgi:acyl-CoA synthetase (AMP-forming)/AMP-acid ligase II
MTLQSSDTFRNPEMPMTEDNLLAVVRRVVAQKPDAVAYRTPERNWTMRELADASDRIAQGLKALGIGPGDRVAALTKHTAECILLTLAACKIGAVFMPVNWRLAAPEVEFIVNDGKARFLMADAGFLPVVEKGAYPALNLRLVTDRAAGHESFHAWYAKFEPLREHHVAAPGETALQLYSSGTTGLPKGVELTHANLLLPQALFRDIWGFQGGKSVMFNALPSFHIAGMELALLTLLLGGETVLQPDFDPNKIIPAIGEHRITHMFLVPAMIMVLVNTPGAEHGDYSSLERIAYGAAPISEKVLLDAMRVFGCGFLQVYGLTETTGAVTFLPPEDHAPGGPRAHLLRSAGKALPGAELRIVDATGKTVPDGEVGEVWIRTVQNMKGYWNNPKATRDVFPEGQPADGGWFRSGDAGYLREGYLFIHDRIKDMIISGGENIYPAEVENALMKHPAVADVAVIGVPDAKWGEAVKACLVLKPGAAAKPEEIIAFAREQIAHYKCPKTIDFLPALPRNPSGKLLKYQLRKPYWEGLERRVN